MWLLLFLLLLDVKGLSSQAQPSYPISSETTPSPSAPMAMMARRLMESLPDLPEVIQGHMTGKTDGLKKMVSKVLGNGLISQLVVDPMRTAEEMGVSIDSLGINKTEMMAKLNNATNGLAGTYLGNPGESKGTGSKGLDFQNLFASTQATTPVMYMDGKPIENFDEFIRSHNYRDQHGKPFFRNQKPGQLTQAATTPVPSAQEIAESVLVALRKNGISSSTPSPPPETPSNPSFDPRNLLPENFDMSLVDPKRMNEVNHLLRRAPQRFDTLSAPPAPMIHMDREIDDVLTTLRTKSFTELSVDQVKQLQAALQQYEQKLQTKELFTKRKQLQVLQNELLEQKKRIEEQRKLEEELRKKEKELEEKRLEMELQLQKQLHSWHSSFNDNPPGMNKRPSHSPVIDLPQSVSEPSDFYRELPPSQAILPTDLNEPLPPETLASPNSMEIRSSAPPSPPSPPAYYSAPIISVKPSATHQIRSRPIDEMEIAEESHKPIKSPLSQLRYSPRDLGEKEEAFESRCECISSPMKNLIGKWYPALSAKQASTKAEKLVSSLLGKREAEMRCSVYEFIPMGDEEEYRIRWHFKTSASSKSKKLTGTASSKGLINLMQFESSRGTKLKIPMCILKNGGKDRFEYMVAVNARGPCEEATLFVRDLNTFFDGQNYELTKFLRHKIAQHEMDPMEILPHAGECR